MSSPPTFIKPDISIADGVPFDTESLDVSEVSWSNSPAKRAFDVIMAMLLVLVTLPFFAIIAIVVKLSSRGPILFRQVRSGRGRTSFVIFKFRTMQRRNEDGPLVTSKDDVRITRAGRILRRFKLDELPQLYNVLLGDMSFVGPRPKVIGHEQTELPCRPGITGAATLIFAREESLLAHIPETHSEAFAIGILHPIKANVDKQYAQQSTFMSDMRLLIRTVLHLGKFTPPHHLEELAISYRISIENHLHDSSNNADLIRDAVAICGAQMNGYR